ncbi:MAG TPA: protoporphyrinogen oxidase [Micromonosporaceae bacterium]|jgi:oxygen-dependent protoporphyrinogen oxidase
MPSGTRRVVVVGGGIAGLTAALDLHDRLGSSTEIVVVEGARYAGGKLRTGTIGGRQVETGAETFLARAADDPSGAPSEAVLLAHRLGLAEALRHPATTAAGILVEGELRAMPAGTLMGVPANASTLDGPWGSADRPDADLGRPVLDRGQDRSVGALVRERVGDAVVDRLVDPLLGGVYAGRADDLSIATTMPGLAAACRQENTLAGAVRAALSRRSTTPGPPFATIDGGLSRFVDTIVAALPAGSVRLGLPVRELAERGDGWRLTIGSTRDPEELNADAVVLAAPSRPAARLLAAVSPEAATAVGALDYASIGLVTFVLPAGALDGTALDGRSGALVPAVEGHLIKAVTVFSTKWAEQPDGAVLLRCSIGRYGDESALQHSDDELVALVAADLAMIVGRSLPVPIASSVTRWGGALPQYAPGHLDRVATARAAVPPTVALAGAAYDGVGIPLCITSGRAAAARIIDGWGE